MNREKSIKALLGRVRKSFEELRRDYETSLRQQAISEELKVDIKNIFENLKSCLDYIAHDLAEACPDSNRSGNLYFPIRSSKEDFDKTVERDFPSLRESNPPVYEILERVQPYNDEWLSKFNKLNNNNKHQDLVEQTKTESRRVTVSSPQNGGSVSWGPGVRFGSGVSVMGVPVDPRTQMPVPNNQVKTEVEIWVDFKFNHNGESVLPFIERSINNVENVFDDLLKCI